ncbi:MAG: Ig-like domain-containing protein [Bacteroidota bacterium]
MKHYSVLLLLSFLFWSCIGDDVIDDFVEPVIRITNEIDSLSIDSSYQFTHLYLNNVGAVEVISPEWSSSDESVLSINADGLATAHAYGPVAITATYDDGMNPATATTVLHTAENPVVVVEPELEARSGVAMATSFYTLEGDFTIEERAEGGVLITFADNFRADTALPDLVLYFTNNPNSIANAIIIADVEIFSGAHQYIMPDVGINDYSHLLWFCRPFNVKVGDGVIVE